jgi:hypothetical protein
MKKILILTIILLSGCASLFEPTGYIEKEECSISDKLSLKPECIGGYSSTMIADNKLLVIFQRNSKTTHQRATDLAILRCSELALNSKSRYTTVCFKIPTAL